MLAHWNFYLVTVLAAIYLAKLAQKGRLKQLPWYISLFVAVTCFIIINWLPIYHYSISEYLYSIFPVISITTFSILFGSLFPMPLKKEKQVIALSTLVTGTLVFISNFGLLGFEFYSLGYDSRVLFLLLPAALVSLYFSKFLFAVCTISWVFWLLDLGRSQNLFDYVIDIPLYIWSLMVVIAKLLSKMQGKKS